MVQVKVDVRNLKNPASRGVVPPNWREAWRRKAEVQELVTQIVSRVTDSGYTSFGVYCSYGKHRSVLVADTAAERLRAMGYAVEVKHLGRL